MLNIRRSRDRLIFNMGVPISGKDGFHMKHGVLALDLGSYQYKYVVLPDATVLSLTWESPYLGKMVSI